MAQSKQAETDLEIIIIIIIIIIFNLYRPFSTSLKGAKKIHNAKEQVCRLDSVKSNTE